MEPPNPAATRLHALGAARGQMALSAAGRFTLPVTDEAEVQEQEKA